MDSLRPADSFRLLNKQVHVWFMRTHCAAEDIARFRSVLSPSELERAARFRFATLHDSSIVTRGALRVLLGRYLNIPPDSTQFQYGGNEKPALWPEKSIRFNISHSTDLAVFAFTLDCEIGVDVELIRPIADMTSIAERFFCREESAELLSLPDHKRQRAFFLCWTRKEAYIKALGNGLSEPLDTFRVTVDPDIPAAFIHVAHDPSLARRWTLQDLPVAPDYAAAVAYRGPARPLRLSPIAPAALSLLIEQDANG